MTTTLATLTQSAAAAGTGELYVVFTVGDAAYAIAASEVLQMESFTGATPVPGTAPWVAGVMPIRGRVVPVVDLRARFGLPSAAPAMDSRVVVVAFGDRAIALLADSAREVVRVAPGDLKPPPQLMGDASSGFVMQLAQPAGRLLLVLDVAKVIGEESSHVR